MSTNPSPELKSLFEAALNEFEKRAGTNLIQHQIIDKLVNCGSADSVIDVLQEQAQAFRNFRGDDGKLMTWLKRTVNVLYTLSTSDVLREDISLVRVFSLLWHASRDTFSFSLFHRQRQSSLDSPYFLAYVSYLCSRKAHVTPIASISQSKILEQVMTHLWIFSSLSSPSSGASTSIQRSHPPLR